MNSPADGLKCGLGVGTVKGTLNQVAGDGTFTEGEVFADIDGGKAH